jgi:hypothetical protein
MHRWRSELPFAVGVALGLAVLIAFGFAERRLEVVGTSDFSYIWAGGRALSEGLDPYAPEEWSPAVARYGVQPGVEPFYVYPPWTALALVPLGVLPLDLAAWIWAIGGAAVAILGLRDLLRAVAPAQPATQALAGFALFASQPGVTSHWSGQWSFLLVGALSFAVAGGIGGGRMRAASALVLLGKPHLFPLALLAVARAHAARRRRPELAILGLGAAALVAVGSPWLTGWLRGMLGGLGPRLAGAREPTTLAVGLGDVAGAAGEVAAAVILLALVAWALRLDPASEAALAVWTALSVVAGIYLWSYDHLVLIVPLTVAVAVASRERPARARTVAAVAFAAFLFIPALLYIPATLRENESYSVLVPLLVAAFAVAVAARHPSETVGAEAAT